MTDTILPVKTFLVVDDDPDDRFTMRLALTRLYPGCSISYAEHGALALSMLAGGEHPDYILMDINMPGMTGLECLAEIKATAGISHIPVIICSTSDNVDDISRSMDLGAHGYVMKQNYLARLQLLIAEAVDKI